MRRVYYSYTLRLATHPLFVHGVLLFGSVYVLSKLIHVASIMNNIRSLRVGDLDNYLFNTFMNAEFATLAVIGVIFFTILSLQFSLKTPHFYKTQTM